MTQAKPKITRPRTGLMGSVPVRVNRDPAHWSEWFRQPEPSHPVVVDKSGGFYRIQTCCGVWDRDRDFHSPTCKGGQS